MNKLYSLISLSKKAGKVAGGETAVEFAIKQKKATLILVAKDASDNTKKKFNNSAAYYNIPIFELGTKSDLGRIIGEAFRAALVITDAGFAKKMISMIEMDNDNDEKTQKE